MEDPPRPVDHARVAELNQLLRLNYDSVAGYTAAIEALEDERAQLALIRLRGDHQRHIVEIARRIRSYGGTPLATPEERAGIFVWDAEVLRSLGGDREILVEFVEDERQVLRIYRQRAEHFAGNEAGRELLRHLEDEERHSAWAERALKRVTAASGRERAA